MAFEELFYWTLYALYIPSLCCVLYVAILISGGPDIYKKDTFRRAVYVGGLLALTQIAVWELELRHVSFRFSGIFFRFVLWYAVISFGYGIGLLRAILVSIVMKILNWILITIIFLVLADLTPKKWTRS